MYCCAMTKADSQSDRVVIADGDLVEAKVCSFDEGARSEPINCSASRSGCRLAIGLQGATDVAQRCCSAGNCRIRRIVGVAGSNPGQVVQVEFCCCLLKQCSCVSLVIRRHIVVDVGNAKNPHYEELCFAKCVTLAFALLPMSRDQSNDSCFALLNVCWALVVGFPAFVVGCESARQRPLGPLVLRLVIVVCGPGCGSIPCSVSRSNFFCAWSSKL